MFSLEFSGIFANFWINYLDHFWTQFTFPWRQYPSSGFRNGVKWPHFTPNKWNKSWDKMINKSAKLVGLFLCISFPSLTVTRHGNFCKTIAKLVGTGFCNVTYPKEIFVSIFTKIYTQNFFCRKKNTKIPRKNQQICFFWCHNWTSRAISVV